MRGGRQTLASTRSMHDRVEVIPNARAVAPLPGIDEPLGGVVVGSVCPF